MATVEQIEKLDRLDEILEELETLGTEAAGLVKELDRGAYDHAMAYSAFSLGRSSNRYNTTLTSVVESLRKKLEEPDAEPEDEEDDLIAQEDAYARTMCGSGVQK